jgi:hypothetical protein
VQRQYSIVLILNCFKERRPWRREIPSPREDAVAAQRFPMRGRWHGCRDDLYAAAPVSEARQRPQSGRAGTDRARTSFQDSAEPESKTVLITMAISTVVSGDAAERPHRNLRP